MRSERLLILLLYGHIPTPHALISEGMWEHEVELALWCKQENALVFSILYFPGT